VNPLDYKIRRNGSVIPFSPALPAVLHGDVAGVIEAVGEQVTAFRPGDEVYAFAGGVKGLGGALADYLLADADLVAYKPVSLSLEQAAALPQAAIAAWDGLMERAKIHAGQTVLVHGATGGVAHLAIQIAKAAGASVFATASSDEKVRIAYDLGAEGAINYRTQSVAEYVAAYTAGKGFDVVFDSIGGANLAQSCQAAAPRGAVISVAAATLDLGLLYQKSLTLHAVLILLPLLSGIGRAMHGRILTDLAQLVDAGKIRPLIDPHSFTFREVADAHQLLEAGQALGKVVLVND
jgi:NADPH2:quinone reductase